MANEEKFVIDFDDEDIDFSADYEQFYGNCGLDIVAYFGQESAEDIVYSVDSIISELKKALNIGKREGKTALVVSTLRRQENANKALVELGALATPWMVRYPHDPSRDCAIWVLPYRELSEDRDYEME